MLKAIKMINKILNDLNKLRSYNLLFDLASTKNINNDQNLLKLLHV